MLVEQPEHGNGFGGWPASIFASLTSLGRLLAHTALIVSGFEILEWRMELTTFFDDPSRLWTGALPSRPE